eukprot:scaffold15170_cov137-Isochrysis_galbana.AAC.2
MAGGALAMHLGAAYAPPEEKNGYAPGWFRSFEYAVTGSNWCGVGNPPDVWAGICVHSQQDGACRRHDMCAVVQRLPEPMFGLALACACDRDLYQGSTEDLERTLYGEGEARRPRLRHWRWPLVLQMCRSCRGVSWAPRVDAARGAMAIASVSSSLRLASQPSRAHERALEPAQRQRPRPPRPYLPATPPPRPYLPATPHPPAQGQVGPA